MTLSSVCFPPYCPNHQTLLLTVTTRNKSYTLPFAHRRNIARLALNPRGNLLLSVDEDGRAILTNIPRRVVLYHFSFKGEVSALAFSPSGRYFAAGIGRQIEVWHTPSTPDVADGDLEFAPFVRHRVYTGHFDSIRSMEWSSDSRFFLTASKDLTAKIWSLDPEEGFIPTTLGGHRQGVVGAWFSKDQETVGMVGALLSHNAVSLTLRRYIQLARTELYSSGNTCCGQEYQKAKKWMMIICNGESQRDTTSCKTTRMSHVQHFTLSQIY